MAQLAATPSCPGLLPLEKARRAIGVRRATLYRLLKNRGEQVEYRLVMGAHGRPVHRAYVPADFIKAAKTDLAGSADRMSASETAKVLGLKYATVIDFVTDGVLPRLTHPTRANGVQVSRAAVEKLRQKRESEDTAAHAPGRWQDVRTLKRTHRMKVSGINRLLLRWVRGRELEPKVGYRWQTRPRRRIRVLLYDADVVARLMASRRDGRKSVSPPPAPSIGTNAADAASYPPKGGDGASTPCPRRRRGRPVGSFDHVAEQRNGEMVQDWQAGLFKNITKLAEAFNVSRGHASNILKEAGVR
jgi:hypothetical protein